MLEKLEQIENTHKELAAQLTVPAIMADALPEYMRCAKAHSELTTIVEKYHEHKELIRGLGETRHAPRKETDPELKALAEEEMPTLQNRPADMRGGSEGVCCCPRIRTTRRTCVLEIRAGTGGDEATLFADGDLPHV